ncbi:TonB-dependent receptor [Alphaproteobacteria bacterium]|nr:TonB-dependent receptor [Alphaproteobacteria bacterium]
MSKSFTKFIEQTILTSLLLGAPAVAQTAVIDEVIVTTTRSDSLRIDNPGNIATLDPSQTVNLFPVELLNQAPGVHIHRGSGQEHLTAIRSPVLVGGAGAGSFLYLEDGIPMRAPGFANVNALMDAMPQADGSVELVRGPGSALYGSNAVHGLVNFISAPLDESGGSADIAIGSYARHAVSLQSAQDHGSFMTRLSLDLNGDADGYRDAQSFAQQKARFESAWQDGATGYRLSIAHMNLNQETAGYAASYEDESIARGNENTEAYRDATATRAYLRMTTDLDSGATLTLTPYLRSNDMEFRMHFLSTADPIEQNEHTSFGLQTAYARTTEKVSYVAGLDVELTEGELTEIQTNDADGNNNYLPGTHYDFDVEAQVIAPYVHAVWRLSDATDLTTGLRWEMTDYDYTNNTDDGLHIVDGTLSKLFRPSSQDNDYSDVSPKIGLVHRLADNRRIFANLARAARAPQVTDLYRLRDSSRDDGIDPDVSDIDSEILDSLEIGYRAVYPALSYEATAFVMQKENYHFRDAGDNYVVDGETDHMGIELSLDWMLARDWTLAANLTYAQHEYAFDNSVTAFRQNTETITDGNTIDGAPETLANTSLRYKYDERTFIKLNWEHVGSYYMDASNSAEYDGHDIFAVTADYVLSGQSRLSLRIDNLFDEAYAKRADKWFGNDRYFPGEGRRFMARISHDF